MIAKPIIIVHTPKCGGIALKQSLSRALGNEAIQEDYGDMIADPASLYNRDPVAYWANIGRPVIQRPVLFGHFHVAKYLHYDQAVKVTLLRHPVERTISHYHYWTHVKDLPPHSIRDHVIAKRLSLEEFAQLDLCQGFYRKIYFRDVDMRVFDLIIYHDQFNYGLQRFAEAIGMPLENVSANETRSIWSDYDQERAAILDSPTRMEQLRELLREEIAFYDSCLTLPNSARRH